MVTERKREEEAELEGKIKRERDGEIYFQDGRVDKINDKNITFRVNYAFYVRGWNCIADTHSF